MVKKRRRVTRKMTKRRLKKRSRNMDSIRKHKRTKSDCISWIGKLNITVNMGNGKEKSEIPKP